MLELVEMEIRELSIYDFPGDDTPIISWFCIPSIRRS